MSTFLASPAELRDASIDRILELARSHLDMDVAFVGTFTGAGRTFRNVVGPPAADLVGVTEPFELTHCAMVADGTICDVVPDTALDPLLRNHVATTRNGVRAFAGVPLVMANGTVYGTLCTVALSPQSGLRSRDVAVLRLLADLVIERLEEEEYSALERRAARERISELIDGGEPSIVLQPIVDLATRAVRGYEALSRFAVAPAQLPDAWFEAAAAAGLGIELEA